MTKEALKLALEALEVANSCVDGYYIPKGKTHLPEIELAITAIKEALASPEQEPMACVTYKEVADTMNGLWGGTIVQRQIAEELENTMLYTTPPQGIYYTPPQRTWVGLTDKDKASFWTADQMTGEEWRRLFAEVEAKLKEKNT